MIRHRRTPPAPGYLSASARASWHQLAPGLNPAALPLLASGLRLWDMAEVHRERQEEMFIGRDASRQLAACIHAELTARRLMLATWKALGLTAVPVTSSKD